MNIKRTTLAAAVAATLTLGVAGQASANVYGVSSLSIDQLTIVLTDGNNAPIPLGSANAVVTNFNFTLTNTATLNGNAAISTATCNQASCLPGPPVLDALPANVLIGNTTVRANNLGLGGGVPNTMGLLGPGTDQYSTSDSVILLSELTGNAGGSETHQIAESELQTGANASASAQINSTTGFAFSFTVGTPGPFNLALSFFADPDMLALLGATEAFGSSAGANMNVSFTLAQNAGGNGFVNWNPQGTAVNDCIAFGGPACVESDDAEDLNINVGTSTPGTSDDHSYGPNIPGFGSFGINVTGLGAGTWTLTLNAVTSTDLQRAVPEPGILALLGIGLAGIGAASRRRNRA